MKSNFFKIAVVLLIGVASAFSMDKQPSESDEVVDYLGHIPGACTPTDVICTDVNTGIMCSNGVSFLHRYEGPNFCPQILFKKL